MSSKLVRSLYGAAALAMPLVTAAAPPAVAQSADVAVITGGGTISPGLDTSPIPKNQSVSFTGTATVIGTDGILATYPCSFTGNGFGIAIAGVGNVSGSCGPVAFESCTFVFTGVHVTVACAPGDLGAADCLFIPNNVNPTTSYSLICEGQIVIP